MDLRIHCSEIPRGHRARLLQADQRIVRPDGVANEIATHGGRPLGAQAQTDVAASLEGALKAAQELLEALAARDVRVRGVVEDQRIPAALRPERAVARLEPVRHDQDRNADSGAEKRPPAVLRRHQNEVETVADVHPGLRDAAGLADESPDARRVAENRVANEVRDAEEDADRRLAVQAGRIVETSIEERPAGIPVKGDLGERAYERIGKRRRHVGDRAALSERTVDLCPFARGRNGLIDEGRRRRYFDGLRGRGAHRRPGQKVMGTSSIVFSMRSQGT